MFLISTRDFGTVYFDGEDQEKQLPSLKLTWPLKMDGWKMNFLLGRPICRGELLVFGRVKTSSISCLQIETTHSEVHNLPSGRSASWHWQPNSSRSQGRSCGPNFFVNKKSSMQKDPYRIYYWASGPFFLAYGCWTKNRGILPPKWMVKIMENPMYKWMIWGYHYFWKHPYNFLQLKFSGDVFYGDSLTITNPQLRLKK